MALHNTSSSYGSVAKFFHWVISLLIIFMLVFGYFLGDFPESMQDFIYNFHKLIGLLVLALMLCRFVWALFNTKPALPSLTPAWQQSAERIFHFALYLFAFLMPLSGWVGSVADNRPPHLGNFQFNLPIKPSKALGHAAFDVHGTTAIILIVLISIHVLAALYHHFIKRDDILLRMLPNRCRR